MTHSPVFKAHSALNLYRQWRTVLHSAADARDRALYEAEGACSSLGHAGLVRSAGPLLHRQCHLLSVHDMRVVLLQAHDADALTWDTLKLLLRVLPPALGQLSLASSHAPWRTPAQTPAADESLL